MGAWSCAACGAVGSEFDAECAACGGPMPAQSMDVTLTAHLDPPDPWIGRALRGYRVVARIGSGGMGIVYQAESPAPPREVALKILAPALAESPEARARFAREARAAARIRSPHVVQILDHGVWENLPVLVMELLRGEDLATRLARDGRLSPRDTAAIVRQVATGLDEAHAAGVIHRDLKPENVFLARDGDREIVKILDFGIAKLRAPDLLEGAKTRTGELLGTPHYMSPEQADGSRAVDHRTDLWSLAVIAFRCVTGKLPFEGEALGNLFLKIISYPLPRPSVVDPRVPRKLDGWWSKAASRDVEGRFGSAREMAAALEEALFSAPAEIAANPPVPETPHGRFLSVAVIAPEPLPCLLLDKPVPFVGRAREIATLKGMFEETESGPVAQVALVLGPAGIGKSRLRQELLAALSRSPRPPEVWMARGDAVSAGSPFGMISGALRRQAAILAGEPADVQRAKLEARFGPLLPDDSRARTLAFLGELVSVPFASTVSPELARARESPMLMRDHLHRAFEDLVAAEGRFSPLVVVLEDLHWGDRPSVDLVDSALRNLPDAPLFVLALGRPEVTSLFPDLWSERRSQTLRLGELLRSHGEALVRAVLGDGIDSVSAADLVDRSAGNPFFLHELVRHFAGGERGALPETVLAVVRERIERLDVDAQRLLQAGSLFGRTFWAEGALALIGDTASRARIDAAIETCVRREVLVRHRTSRLAGQTEVAFRHALLGDAASAMVEESARAAGHLRAAEWLERAGEHDAVALAEHFERGGDPARAAEAYKRAAAQALEGNDFAAAIDRAERAVAAGAHGETLGILRRVQAEAHGYRDEHAEAQERGREAMRLLPEGSPAWCAAAVDAARASASRADHDTLASIAAEAARLPLEGATPAQVICTARMATHVYAADLRAEATRLLERAEGLASRPGASDLTSLAWLHHARAWSAFTAEDAAASLHHEELSVRAFDEAGDERDAAYVRVGLGHAYREVGALAEAESTLREALRTALRLGLPNVALGAEYTLTAVLFYLGRHAEARDLARVSLAAFQAKGDAARVGYARIELARIAAATGDLATAEAEAEAAQTELRILPPARAHALGVLASVHLLAGRPEKSLVAAREALRIGEQVGGLPEGEMLVRLMHAESLEALGDPESTAALASARDHLLAHAARIPDAGLRRSYLQNLPENARILALSRRCLETS